MSDDTDRREAISDDRAWQSGYLAGRAAAMRSDPAAPLREAAHALAATVRLPGESPCSWTYGAEGMVVCDVHGWQGSRNERRRVLVCVEAAANVRVAAPSSDPAAPLDVERLAEALVIAVRSERAPIGGRGDGWPAYVEPGIPATVLNVNLLARAIAREYAALAETKP